MTTKVQAQDVAVLNASPSDASGKRTNVCENFSFQTINTTERIIHTPASGYSFYLTDLIVTVESTLTSISIIRFRDDDTNVIPFIAKKTTTGAESGYTTITMSFKEPIKFTTDINIIGGNASGVTGSVVICGYDEADDLKS